MSQLQAIGQKIHGRALQLEPAERILLIEKAGAPFIVRYGLPLLEAEGCLLPALLLDDWGKEIKGLALYDWIAAYGAQFPRAELFGFDPAGRQRQYFLREIDLNSRYPCYLYQSATTPLPAGQQLTGVAFPDDQTETRQRIKRPAQLPRPLRQAQVAWWRLNPHAFDAVERLC